jgi:ATP-dependent helicase IRC3
VRAGDYDERALSAAVNTPARNGMAVSAYQAHAQGRSALVFCVDRRHVADMTAAFTGAGLAAAGLTGDLPRAERQGILERYRRRQITVLVNCAILTEGVDLPLTSAVVLARPTRSLTLLAQQVGRALRLPAPAGAGPGAAPGDAVIIDLTDSTTDAGLRTIATLVGLPPRLRFRGELVLEAKRRIERALEQAPWTASAVELGRLVTVEDVLAASREVDLLYAELPMPAAFERARWAWIAVPPQRWVVSTPLGTLMIRQTVLDYRVVWTPRAGEQTDLGATPLLEDAIAAAEAWGRAMFTPDTLRLVDRRAAWRTRPATERQRALLDRLGIAWDEQTTAEAASRAIERRLRGLRPAALARWMPGGEGA